MQNTPSRLIIPFKTFIKELNLGKSVHFSLFSHKSVEFQVRWDNSIILQIFGASVASSEAA